MIKFLWIYKYIAFPSLTVTFIQACLQCFTAWDDIVYFVWIKWFTMAAITFYVYMTRSNEIYFFHNLGVSTFRFYVSMIAIDFSIFCITMLTVIKLS